MLSLVAYPRGINWKTLGHPHRIWWRPICNWAAPSRMTLNFTVIWSSPTAPSGLTVANTNITIIVSRNLPYTMIDDSCRSQIITVNPVSYRNISDFYRYYHGSHLSVNNIHYKCTQPMERKTQIEQTDCREVLTCALFIGEQTLLQYHPLNTC